MITAAIIVAALIAAAWLTRRELRTTVTEQVTLEQRLTDHAARVQLDAELDATVAAAFELDQHSLANGIRPSVSSHLGHHVWVRAEIDDVHAPEDGVHPATLAIDWPSAVAFHDDGSATTAPTRTAKNRIRLDFADDVPLGAKLWLVLDVVDNGDGLRLVPLDATYGTDGFPTYVAEAATR